ncbi:hypothetical protein [Pendulispora albinea]|uniref:Tryptophan synthase alpha chain n=1 Tax=Pendulispora albinea TaxID=2741071 RepID=A0ABZ2LR00_9BACT
MRRSRRALIAGALACVLVWACTGDLRFAGDAGTPSGADRDGSSDDGQRPHDAGAGGDGGGIFDGGPPRCTLDAECGPFGLRCDPILRICVQCSTDAHCSGDAGWPRCDPALHRCVVCQTNSDCPPTMTCEPTTRRCVFSCEGGSGCIDGRRCDSSRGMCISCTLKSECSLLSCETATGSCTECAGDNDCPSARPHCDRTRGLCAQCVTQHDCPQSSVCDYRSNTCVVVP